MDSNQKNLKKKKRVAFGHKQSNALLSFTSQNCIYHHNIIIIRGYEKGWTQSHSDFCKCTYSLLCLKHSRSQNWYSDAGSLKMLIVQKMKTRSFPKLTLIKENAIIQPQTIPFAATLKE